ncbi:DUF4157 domain-containing protein [Streptomyces taklimakanensis]|uniref:eCIS core domain-containing protein n=1 Tax=Streptomyces taklimakanensis TaxID=2569853 RepID=UPI001EE3D7F2|nr:DUF4157 domain-containing protein [Streptomyces taklimakanensis]
MTRDGGAEAVVLASLQRTVGNAVAARMLQRARSSGSAGRGQEQESGASVQRSSVHDVLRRPGSPLDGPVRQEMESRLGADFSDVRVHTDSAARASAAEVGARAYTSGSHIVLGDGGGDRHTLAHELTHVIQQRRGPVAGTDNGTGLRISDPGDRFEREAETNATRALAGPAPSAGHTSEHPVGKDHADGAAALQRHIVEIKKGTPGTAETQLFEAFFTAVDRAVQWAYDYVTTAPQLGPLKDYDGYTKRWVEVWQKFHAEGRSGGISKEFGYAIESIAQARLEGEGAPALPGNARFATQVTYGSTRPDYVLYSQGQPIGAVDITATASTGHVLDKTSWDALFPQFGESVYPSLDPVVIAGMKLAHDNTARLTQQQADQLKQQAAANRAMWEENWGQMGASFMADMQRQGIVNAAGQVKGGGDPIVRATQRRTAVFSWMTEKLGVDQATAESNATVMLLTFNRSWPESFSCNDSTASVSRGEAFLTSVYPEWKQRQGV